VKSSSVPPSGLDYELSRLDAGLDARTWLGSQSVKGAFGHAKDRPAPVYPAHVDRFNLDFSGLYHLPVLFIYYVEGVVSLPELALLPQ
jgi:hypothetical protein